MSTVALTVDVEPDCPPFLWGFRGIEQGLPRLMDLLAKLKIPGTFFTTGDVARKYPEAVDRIVRDGHELACHGMTHTAFDRMDRGTAATEIRESAAILRQHDRVSSFRAPYLRFPLEYVSLLEEADFTLDSSQAIYKLEYRRNRGRQPMTSVRRIPASVTSSVLRIPKWLRRAYLSRLSDPVVLFVHPWEFVDLTHERLRYDCRFRTGQPALDCVEDVLRAYQTKGARFVRMRELLSRDQRVA